MNPKISWPVIGKFPISFLFGEKPDWYVKIFGYPHNGLDISCPVGTSVIACDEGYVVFADDIPDEGGKGAILRHSWGTSLYWHLNSVPAKIGDHLTKGEFIGSSGKTGYVTGPHLHFGIKVDGQAELGMRGWINPLPLFEEYSPPPTPPGFKDRFHIVLPGQTLWGLAEKYYGNGLKWSRIYIANKEQIANPNLIKVFQKLLIP